MNRHRVLKLQKRIAQLRMARRQLQRWVNLYRQSEEMRKIRPDALRVFEGKLSLLGDSLKRLRKQLASIGAAPATANIAMTLQHHMDIAL